MEDAENKSPNESPICPVEAPLDFSETLAPSAPEGKSRPRPWLTLICAVVVGLSYLVAQTLAFFVMFAMEARTNPELDVATWGVRSQNDGTIIAVCAIAGAMASVPLTLAFGRMVGGGATDQSLGLRPTCLRSIIGWTLVALAMGLAIDWLTWTLGGEVTPPFMRQWYQSARPRALLWLALCVAAPFSEELLFRGLIYGGLINTRLGFPGTALVTAIAWAALHLQYNASVMAVIALGGLLLAVARHRTKSVYPCLSMHAALNAVATIEAAYAA